MHDVKNADYGSDEDPFCNVRQAEDFGISPWVAAVLRGNDKMTRIKTFLRKGSLKCESLEDSLKDLANYSIIALALLRQESQAKDSPK